MGSGLVSAESRALPLAQCRLDSLELALREHPAVADAHVEPALSASASDRLTALIVPARAGSNEAEREHVKRWSDVYDSLYAGSTGTYEATFNTAGWRSRSDRKPIAESDMRAWARDTVERILADAPATVLEVGCGTGLLLFPTAPFCRRYLGTDASATAIDILRPVLARERVTSPWAANVELAHCPAHEIARATHGRAFDTVILNSVVQHFPSVEYFEQALAVLLGVTERPGRIYIGDIRNLRLLTTFHVATALSRARPYATLEELRERVRRGTAAETELLLSPEYFLTLQHRFPDIRHVEIQLKRGRYLDELSLFRYEVVLHLGDVRTVPLELQLCWSPEMDCAFLQRLLVRHRPPTLHVRAVPNRSLDACCLRADALRYGHIGRAQELESIGLESNSSSAPDPGLEPSAVVRSGRAFGYSVEIHRAADGNPRRFDAVFRNTSPRGPLPLLPATTPPALAKATMAQTAPPSMEHLGEVLRSYLERRFPEQAPPSCLFIAPRLSPT